MDSKHTLSPETVLDIRPRYIVFKVPPTKSLDDTQINGNEGGIYYIGPYPRPLANYIKVRMLHHRDKQYNSEWTPKDGYSWVETTRRVRWGKYSRYHSPYPIEGIQSQLSGVIAYWHRVCHLLDVVDTPAGKPLEDEGEWGYLRYYKGSIPHHLGPYPIPVLKVIRKYLAVQDLLSQDTNLPDRDIISHCIYRNPQLGSTLDTSVTYEMVQEFSRERLLMYQSLYELTVPFTSMEE